MRRSQHARKETEFLRLKRTRLGLEDFESLKVIGRGAFGEVKTFYINTGFPCAIMIPGAQVHTVLKHILELTVFQCYFKVSVSHRASVTLLV